MSARQTVRSKRFSVVSFLALVGLLLAGTVSAGAHCGTAGVPPSEQPASYHIGYYTTSYYVSPYGWYTATIRYPALQDGLRARPNSSGKPYAGIVVTDGYLSIGSMIDWIPEQLTSCGYVTLCFTTPNPSLDDDLQWAAGFNGGISKLQSEANTTSPLSPIYKLLNTNRFGVIGLSSGGAGAMIAAGNNSQIKVVVALAPDKNAQTDLAAPWIAVPIQLQVGSNDQLNPPASVSALYAEITNAPYKDFEEISGGNHVGYLNEWAAKLAQPLSGDGNCTIGFAMQRQLASGNFTSFFENHP
jgi:dienelactone hydrolase